MDLTQADFELEEKLVNYCAEQGLMNCHLKQTKHGTIGAFYYGNSNYICEINHIPDDSFNTKTLINEEVERCRKWINSFIDSLKIQRIRESEQSFFIRAYIWVRRFLDPGYTFPFKREHTNKMVLPFDIADKEKRKVEIKDEIFADIKQTVEKLEQIESFDTVMIKQKDDIFFIVTKKIDGNNIRTRAFDSTGKELAGIELVKIIDIPAYIDYEQIRQVNLA